LNIHHHHHHDGLFNLSIKQVNCVGPEMSIVSKGKGEDNRKGGIDNQTIQETDCKQFQSDAMETSNKPGDQNQF
jgi:hypothetical protein